MFRLAVALDLLFNSVFCFVLRVHSGYGECEFALAPVTAARPLLT
jgi:hypothetical protein